MGRYSSLTVLVGYFDRGIVSLDLVLIGEKLLANSAMRISAIYSLFLICEPSLVSTLMTWDWLFNDLLMYWKACLLPLLASCDSCCVRCCLITIRNCFHIALYSVFSSKLLEYLWRLHSFLFSNKKRRMDLGWSCWGLILIVECYLVHS